MLNLDLTYFEFVAAGIDDLPGFKTFFSLNGTEITKK